MQTYFNPSSSSVGSRHPALDPVNVLFLIGAFLAPWDLSLGGSGFTAYDVVLVVVAFMMLATRRRWQFLSFQFTAAVYVFILFAVLSTFRAPQPVESLTQIVQFIFIFFVQIPIIFTLVKSQWLFRMSLLMFVSGMLVGVISSLAVERFQGAGRTLAFYSENPNRLGYTTAYFLPFVLHLLFEAWRTRRTLAVILASGALLLMIWALLASGSRSATVGTLVTAVVFLTFYRGFEINLKTMLRLLLVVAVIGLVSYWFYQSDFFPTTLRHRIERTLMQEASLTRDRTSLAEAGWLAFLDSPFIGVGFDNFRYVAGQYVFMTHQLPHNMWLQFLAQIGLVGTLAFFALLVRWFVPMFRAQGAIEDRSQRELMWAFIASMIGIITIYMFVPLMIQRQYWLIYGLGLVLANGLREGQARSMPESYQLPGILPRQGTALSA